MIIGATGGVGAALTEGVRTSGAFSEVIGLSRSSEPALDLTDEASVKAAAEDIGARGAPLRLILVATGFLHDEDFQPERANRALDPDHLARAFALNATGPALIAKHFTPLMPREGKSVFAALSARVGSIGDNRLGGWHAYRASKAALNQLVRTMSIEVARKRKAAILACLHPGTVATRLSEPFSKRGLDVRPPDEAAADILSVIDGLTAADTGGFFDHKGDRVDW